MDRREVRFIVIKKKNMIKSEDEEKYYPYFSKLGNIIETLFSLTDNFGLEFI